ncbi:MAG: threonine/serine exporter family protein [Firmicutes bacterium]|nr:threonine/serine exporter family protein [Bacillota bacterium]
MQNVVDVILLAGEVLLTSGAEIHRVEETIERMGRAAGFVEVEVYATPTGLFISLYSAQGQVFSRVRRIRRVSNHLEKIACVNALSRAYSSGVLSTAELREALGRLTEPETGPPWSVLLASGLGCAAFAVIFGGSPPDACFAGIMGFLVTVLQSLLSRHPVPLVVNAALGGAVAALGSLFGQSVFALDGAKVIMGAVMVLVPGVTMTTALRDMLSGELVSGVSRGAEALAVAVAVAAGVAGVLSLGVL